MIGTALIAMLATAMLSGVHIATATPTPEDGPIQLGKLLHRRQDQSVVVSTNLVGDGNPHQVPFDMQVSDNMDCGTASGCSVSVTMEHTVGFSVSAEGGGEWISGGFDVEESYTDGETHECDGDAGDEVCVWHTYGYTSYTVVDTTCLESVETGELYDCGTGDSYIINSPNNCQVGAFYCVEGGACRSDGQGYYGDATAAGGPSC